MSKKEGSTNPTDAILLKNIAHDDKIAYKRLIEKYVDSYWRVAMALAGDSQLAESVIHVPFTALWELRANIPSDVLSRGFFIWGYRILIKRCCMITVPLAADKQKGLQALNSLSDEAMIAWALFQFEELSIKEISVILQVSEEELLPLLQNARIALKATFKDAPTYENRDIQGES